MYEPSIRNRCRNPRHWGSHSKCMRMCIKPLSILAERDKPLIDRKSIDCTRVYVVAEIPGVYPHFIHLIWSFMSVGSYICYMFIYVHMAMAMYVFMAKYMHMATHVFMTTHVCAYGHICMCR